MRKYLSIGAILAVCVVLAWFLSGFDFTKKEGREAENMEADGILAGLVIATSSVSEESADPWYKIEINYPKIDGREYSRLAVDAVNSSIENMVVFDKNEFLEGMKDSARLPDMPDYPSEFVLRYKTHLATSSILSFRFDGYTYMVGSAHPSSYVETKNYDMRTGLEFELKDIFKSDSDYLNFISAYVINSLREQYKEDREALDMYVEEGAGPKENNFREFVLEEDGIHFIFNSYQVAPYALGIPEVFLPYDKAIDKFREEGPLGARLNNS